MYKTYFYLYVTAAIRLPSILVCLLISVPVDLYVSDALQGPEHHTPICWCQRGGVTGVRKLRRLITRGHPITH
jgi:hypothetical protein